jgi:urea transport system substrate-binding protein
VLGDELELVFADCGLTERDAVTALDFLLDIDGVDAVVGTHTSDIRDAVASRLNGLVPYVYTSQHEGLPGGAATVAIGSTDPELLEPSIHWLAVEKHAKRFFFVGNDYIWPRTALRTTRRLLADRRLDLVGQAFVPTTTLDHGHVLEAIKMAAPDVVVIALVGTCGIAFNRMFGASGLDEKILRFELLLDETVICGVGAENSNNLFTASHYFANRSSAPNDRFLENYHDAYGDLAPPASASSLGCYEGIHVMAGLVREAGWKRTGLSPRRLWRPISRQSGRRRLDHSPIAPNPKVHVAAADGVTFQVVASI